MDWRDTSIFLNNFNRLNIGFRDLLLWLRRAGMTSICVIDNGSTFPPLLDFYGSPAMDGIQLIRAANLGHEAIWKLGLHNRPDNSRFIYTDADILPDPQCPLDLVRKMHEVTDRFFLTGAKVGPALRIDNLPSCYAQRDHMRRCESDYWLRKHAEGDCWDAALDTTMALYESGWGRWPLATAGGVQHVRLDFPYVVNHIPWHSDSANLTDEERYYQAHVEGGYSSSCPVAIPEEPANV